MRFGRETEHRLHQIFELSLLAKGLFAVSETLSGVALYFVSADWLIATVRWLTQQEITEDPTDGLALWLMNAAQGLSLSTINFWALYLISHGLVKLALVAALAFRVLWAYPASILVLVGFIFYQLERFYYTHSPLMIALTVFDIVVIWLVWHEYQRMKGAVPQ